MFEVTTLGQPFEVIKTQMASNRTQTMYQALKTVWNRGGVLGFYQGLIPWAWIEASTKGAVLLFTSTEVQKVAKSLGMGPGAAGLLGGMTGGIVQSYATMGFCTCMKTVEITRQKQVTAGVPPPSTWKVFADIYSKEGIRGINKGVNAVAVRQMTNWGSRMGFARLAESPVRRFSGKTEGEKLNNMERILCSTIGGALATWNQPIEVIRVEVCTPVWHDKLTLFRCNRRPRVLPSTVQANHRFLELLPISTRKMVFVVFTAALAHASVWASGKRYVYG